MSHDRASETGARAVVVRAVRQVAHACVRQPLHSLALLANAVAGCRRRGARSTGDEPSGSLRVVLVVPTYPPFVLGGAERSAASIARFLARQGHQVRVLTPTGRPPFDEEGVRVCDSGARRGVRAAIGWAEVVLTQQGAYRAASRLAQRYGVPLVYMTRTDSSMRQVVRWPAPDLVVYNAAWIREAAHFGGPSMVLHPPIECADYATRPGHHVTAINTDPRKGGRFVFELAEALPDHEFLAVVAGWGAQQVPEVVPANVTVVNAADDVREIYGRTRVLLVPSRWEEAFGRVAIEAACSGIPVIATPRRGLREALGPDGLFAPEGDVEAWCQAIRSLDDDARYREASEAASRRASVVATEDGLRELEARLQRLARGRGAAATT